MRWVALTAALLTLAGLALLLRRGYRAHRLLERRVAELSALSEAGRAIVAAQLDVDELCMLIYRQAHQIVDTWIFQLGLFEGHSYRIKVWIVRGERQPEAVFDLSEGEGIVGWMRRTGQSLLVRDFEAELDTLPARPRYISDDPPRSAVFVPLVAGETVIGALAIQSDRPAAFTPDHQRVLSIIANQAASALENARLYAAGQEEAWISTALLEVAEATSLSTSVDEVLETVVRITPLLVGVDRCAILLWDEGEEACEVTAAYETAGDGSGLQVGQVVPPGTWPLLDRLWESGSPVVDEFGGLPGAPATQDVETTLLALPLRAHGELIGAMVIGFTGQVSFTEHRIKLIAGVANQAALAIESAQLVVAQQEEAWVSLALLQVAEAVGTLSELDEVLAVVARLTPLLVGVESCLIYLWDAAGRSYVPGAAYGLSQVDLFQTTPVPAAAWPEMALAAPADGAGDERTDQEPGDQALLVPGPPHPVADVLGLHFPLALPLLAWGEPMGALVVDTLDGGAQLADRRLNILTGVAQQTATAIQNARLHADTLERQKLERELQLARQIQVSFLPDQVPQVPGWDLAAYWQGARQVSGDFYDFVPLPASDCPGGRWGLVVADVADKGMPAALFMALSRTLVRTMAISGRSPAEVLARANDMIMADSRSDLFVTLFYAILDPERGVLSYANAGHNPPLLFSGRSGKVRPLAAQGMALGIATGLALEQREVRLAPGDLVLFYTDGVTDALNSEMDEFGLKRLRRAVEAHRTGSAADVIQAINQAVAEFVGDTPQFDDLTMVVLKRQPLPAS